LFTNVFAFDIETVPDVDGGRRLYRLEGLSDRDAANAMMQIRRQETGDSEFLRLHLHRIVAISAILRTEDRFQVWSLGESTSPEKELIQRFFDGVARYRPVLVSWNGGGFDLPVLHYRALLHGVPAPSYWEIGERDPGFRWNNYLNRYHMRHTDLMDVLAAYQPRAMAPLDEVAVLIGLPGKMGQSGAQVWERFQSGDLEGIRQYCEIDALNTFLIYLRFELLRGNLDQGAYADECQRVRQSLTGSGKPHLEAFGSAWS
jgi:predicted PolB exonuclease-like 3'-5' exonuclease